MYFKVQVWFVRMYFLIEFTDVPMFWISFFANFSCFGKKKKTHSYGTDFGIDTYSIYTFTVLPNNPQHLALSCLFL